MESTIDIKISCPISMHNEIEEYCINNGISLTNYFIDLHKINTVFHKEREKLIKEESEQPEAPNKKKGGKR